MPKTSGLLKFLEEVDSVQAKTVKIELAEEIAHKINKDGETALLIAVYTKDIGDVDFLLKAKADPDLKYGVQQQTVAMMAVIDNSKHITNDDKPSEVLKSLIKGGAKLNLQDKLGFTVATYAAALENLEDLKLLSHADADFTIENNDGKNAFDCMKPEHKKIVKEILLIKAVYEQNTDEIRSLLKEDTSPYAIFKKLGKSPVGLASTYGRDAYGRNYVEVLKVFKEEGVDFNKPADNLGNTAAMIAVNHKETETLLFLATTNADFEKINNFGESAFSVLEKNQKENIIKEIKRIQVEETKTKQKRNFDANVLI